MRPRSLDEVLGQDHLLSGDSLLLSASACGRLPSIILWGPPGTGKTSIARALVSSCPPSASYRFVSLSAVTAGVKEPPHLSTLIKQASIDPQRGILATIKATTVEIEDSAVKFLSLNCDGDGLVALNVLEAAARALAPDGHLYVACDNVKEALTCKHLAYDRAGEEHYNLISALHKSMRRGDADAAIY
ncbi:hypothetical protein SASPL_129864 [Salvia splendens]|uniref:ATPase AAA-type core domain-containing protein n=1 Tax=Salvia splendens TaxID=180675 RepID=A0A8X8XC29_SALSN|nr:hypothetical protein SASPL_129864 [Salvia splendens]